MGSQMQCFVILSAAKDMYSDDTGKLYGSFAPLTMTTFCSEVNEKIYANY